MSLFRPETKGSDSSFAGYIEQLVGRDSESWTELTVDGYGSTVMDNGVKDDNKSSEYLDDPIRRDTWITDREENIRA